MIQMSVLHILLIFSLYLNSCFFAFCQLQMMAGFHPQRREQKQHRLIHRH